jgi:radical SAM superfamily enzyme YgiQ (UPF0313 family)
MNWKQKKQCETLLSREQGFVKKIWGTCHTVCLAYPNVYRIGMANLGFQAVYKIFNELPSFLCERVFLPASGDDAEFVTGAAETVSLENQRPVRDFDILAVSISFENDYPSVLNLLKRSGLPLMSKDREERHPLVVGGGIALTLNPEPLADFFDVFILGEAEETLPRFAAVFAEARQLELDKKTLLLEAQKKIPGIYVPSLYKVNYSSQGKIKDIVPIADGLPGRIQISSIKNINAFSTTEVISSCDSEMADMFLVEVNRGCPHLCRFCAAGHVYAPPRFRSCEDIISAVDCGLCSKKKIGLVGTAVSDHPDLMKICQYIVDRGAQAGIGSLRLDRINENTAGLIKSCGIETVALAPEAGSQRLRDFLRKGIALDDILNAARCLIEQEISNLRLYFMLGLPTEEEKDIDAMIDLVKKIQHEAIVHTSGKRKFRRIILSLNQFIPKPRTPLQWCALANVQDVAKKIKKITRAFHQDRQIHVIADVPKWNYVQALLSLGDRRVSEILLAVHSRNGNWSQALRDVNIHPDFYVYRQKDLDEIMPWDIIDIGTSKKRLLREYEKAFSLHHGATL